MNKKNKEICKIVDWLVEGFENDDEIPPAAPSLPPQPPPPPPPAPPPDYDSVISGDRLSPQLIYDSLQYLQTNSPPRSSNFPSQSQFSPFDSRSFDSRSFEFHRDINPFESRILTNPIPTTHFQPQPFLQCQPEASFYPSFVPSQSQSLPHIPQTTTNNFDQFQTVQPTFQQNGSSFYGEPSVGFQSDDTGFKKNNFEIKSKSTTLFIFF